MQNYLIYGLKLSNTFEYVEVNPSSFFDCIGDCQEITYFSVIEENEVGKNSPWMNEMCLQYKIGTSGFVKCSPSRTVIQGQSRVGEQVWPLIAPYTG